MVIDFQMASKKESYKTTLSLSLLQVKIAKVYYFYPFLELKPQRTIHQNNT